MIPVAFLRSGYATTARQPTQMDRQSLSACPTGTVTVLPQSRYDANLARGRMTTTRPACRRNAHHFRSPPHRTPRQAYGGTDFCDAFGRISRIFTVPILQNVRCQKGSQQFFCHFNRIMFWSSSQLFGRVQSGLGTGNAIP